MLREIEPPSMVLQTPLSNVQLELLKMFSRDLSEQDLLNLRRLLARFLAEKASDELDQLWDERGWSDETMDSWLSDEGAPK